jgi:hypothetical protein
MVKYKSQTQLSNYNREFMRTSSLAADYTFTGPCMYFNSDIG